MKKVIFTMLTLSITILGLSQTISNSTLYSGYSGAVRDQAPLSNGKILYINTNTVNAGSPNSPFMVIGDPCAKVYTPVVVAPTWDLTANFIPCLFYVIEQKPGSVKKITGVVRSTSGKNVVTVDYDPVTNIATPNEQFYLTGANANVGIKLNGNYISADSIRFWSEVNIPFELNGIVTVPAFGVFDVCVSTSAIVLRDDLVMWEAGNPSMTSDVLLLTNGKRMHVGSGTQRGGASGPVALHGFIEDPTTTLIIDLNFPGSGLTFVNKAIEVNGSVYIAHSFSAPTAPLSPTLVKMDMTTFALSSTNCPYKMTVSDMDTVGGRTILSGSPKSVGPTASVVAYDPIAGTWEDWSGTLFATAGPSSNVNTILAFPCTAAACPYALSVTGNFQSGSGGNTASGFTHIAQSCRITNPLAVKLISFTVQSQSSGSALYWETATPEDGSTFELQKGTNGVDFTTINTQLGDVVKKNFSFVDQTASHGLVYYQLKMTDINDKITYSAKLKIVTGKENISVYPNPVLRGGTVQITASSSIKSWKLLTVAGQVVATNSKVSGTATTVQIPVKFSGLYYVSVETANENSVSKIIVQ